MSDWKMVPVVATQDMRAAYLSKCWRERWEEGKRLQRAHGLEAVPPKTECEEVAGLWSFMLAAAPSPWQDIATAPKNDGRYIHLFGDGEGFRLCQWIGWWDSRRNAWVAPDAGWTKPTHWMPLPEPPT